MRNESGRKSKKGKPQPEIPDKLYFRIGEVSQMLDLPSYVLRFWETEFPSLKPGKGGTGQRLYRRRDVEALLEVRRLLYEEGYTIPGARQLLKERVHAPEPELTPQSSHSVQAATAVPLATLQHLRNGLRELASLLATPAVKTPHTRPGTHGLHRTDTKRVHTNTPSLFAVPESATDDGSAE